MSGLWWILIGGGINAYRIIRRTGNSDNPGPYFYQGVTMAFTTGAAFYGLPLWGLYLMLMHYKTSFATLTAFLVFSILMSIGVWEWHVIRHSILLCGSEYETNLPRAVRSRGFQLLTRVAASGAIIVPIFAWTGGAYWAIGLTFALTIVAYLMGSLLFRLSNS